MDRSGLRAVVFVVLAAACTVTGIRADDAPARAIDGTTCDAVKELLPPPVVEWIRRGDLTLVLSHLNYEPGWEPAFVAASEANAGRYDVDRDGGLIDRVTGERPAHTYGLPFPHVEPNDPQAGVKVMWNVSLIDLKTGALRVPFILQWIGRSGFERAVRGVVAVLPFDGQPTLVPNPDRTEQRQLFRAVGPASVEGLATLTWRYMDNRPDSVWGYMPTIRRVREFPAANRSEPAYGSDLVQDDGLLWAGKNQSFRWKLVRRQEVLVSTAATGLVRLLPGDRGPNGREFRSPPEYPGARLGWRTPGWQGAPWLPTNMVWLKRPVWIVEGYPKDPYYNYGRQVFYIDAVTYMIYYKIVYTRAGDYWKTLVKDFGMGTTSDHTERQAIGAAVIAVDERADHATYANGAGPDAILEFHSSRLRPNQFTEAGLLRLGK